jgi:hypothetical protein
LGVRVFPEDSSEKVYIETLSGSVALQAWIQSLACGTASGIGMPRTSSAEAATHRYEYVRELKGRESVTICRPEQSRSVNEPRLQRCLDLLISDLERLPRLIAKAAPLVLNLGARPVSLQVNACGALTADSPERYDRLIGRTERDRGRIELA